MSPKSFLHQLGIKPKRKNTGSLQVGTSETITGRRPPTEIVDLMGTQAMDSLFENEELAVETLGRDFDRLANSMDRLAKSPVFEGHKLSKVGELGGGCGILGMWLANKNLCETCEIFDHAKNPITLGQNWARALSLNNIKFHNMSYSHLAAGAPNDFDFVFAEHAVDLFSLKNPSVTTEEYSFFYNRYHELAGAFRKMLQPKAFGLIAAGSPTLPALFILCKALREQHLSIDWKLSSNTDGLLLYISPKFPTVFTSTDDEALAILADALPPRKLSQAEAFSFERMFREGTKYVEVASESDGVEFYCAIFQRAGLATLCQKTSNGHATLTLFGAGRMLSWADDVLADARKRKLTSQFIDKRLAEILIEKPVISAIH